MHLSSNVGIDASICIVVGIDVSSGISVIDFYGEGNALTWNWQQSWWWCNDENYDNDDDDGDYDTNVTGETPYNDADGILISRYKLILT